MENLSTQDNYGLIEAYFDDYLKALLDGKRKECQKDCIEAKKVDVPIEILYEQLFKRALYQVGELWEQNTISVATEHIATAVTEGLMNIIYADLVPKEPVGHKVIVCSAINEQHQVGAKMVADIFELFGWDCYFLGSGTPVSEIMELAKEKKPDLIAISLSIYMNMHNLELMLNDVRKEQPDIPILLGGQAFNYGSGHLADKISNFSIANNLIELENYIDTWSTK